MECTEQHLYSPQQTCSKLPPIKISSHLLYPHVSVKTGVCCTMAVCVQVEPDYSGFPDSRIQVSLWQEENRCLRPSARFGLSSKQTVQAGSVAATSFMHQLLWIPNCSCVGKANSKFPQSVEHSTNIAIRSWQYWRLIGYQCLTDNSLGTYVHISSSWTTIAQHLM